MSLLAVVDESLRRLTRQASLCNVPEKPCVLSKEVTNGELSHSDWISLEISWNKSALGEMLFKSLSLTSISAVRFCQHGSLDDCTASMFRIVFLTSFLSQVALAASALDEDSRALLRNLIMCALVKSRHLM